MEHLAYSINEVVELTGVSRSRIYQLVTSGELRTRKLGRRTLVLSVELTQWLSSLPERDERLASK